MDQVGRATYDIAQDEGAATRLNKPSQLKWDRKKKRMVKTEVGADNKKLIRTESGALLPASYKSGRYDEWRKSRRGQTDQKSDAAAALETGRSWRHKVSPAERPSLVYAEDPGKNPCKGNHSRQQENGNQVHQCYPQFPSAGREG